MANFTLSTNDDDFTGTVHGDVFSGPSGGIDTLDGGAGKDLFILDSDEAGTIIGGDGLDTVRLAGFNLGTLTFEKVENLDLADGGTNATAAQLSSFSKIYCSNNIGDIEIGLTGDGGTLDLGALWKGHESIHVDAFGAGNGTGFTITGTAHQDFLAGSDFADTIHGGGGNDVLNARGGTGDVLSGDDGNDTITSFATDTMEMGGNGKDALFSYSGGTMMGGDGNDRLSSTLGSTYIGGAGADHLIASDGPDIFEFDSVSDSTSTSFDTIKRADFRSDTLHVPVAVTGIDPAVFSPGTVTLANFDTDLATVADGSRLEANHAVELIEPAGGDFSDRIILVIDQNGVAGYQASQDLVVVLVHAVDSSLSVSNFT